VRSNVTSGFTNLSFGTVVGTSARPRGHIVYVIPMSVEIVIMAAHNSDRDRSPSCSRRPMEHKFPNIRTTTRTYDDYVASKPLNIEH
jgi:hypothetical protein